MRKSSSAFTIIELLVVVAVITVLASFSVAGANQLMTNAKAVHCLNNLKQIGIASHNYAADNDGLLPQSTHQGKRMRWAAVLTNYISTSMFAYPLDTTGRANSYAINDYVTVEPAGAHTLNFSRLQNIPSPSKTFYMAVRHRYDTQSDHFHFAEEGCSAAVFAGQVWVEVVNGSSSHYLFVDGHVEELKWTDVQAKLSQPGARFVRPDGINL